MDVLRGERKAISRRHLPIIIAVIIVIIAHALWAKLRAPLLSDDRLPLIVAIVLRLHHLLGQNHTAIIAVDIVRFCGNVVETGRIFL